MWKVINLNYFVLIKNKAYGIRETEGMGFIRNYKSTLIVIDEDIIVQMKVVKFII